MEEKERERVSEFARVNGALIIIMRKIESRIEP